MWSSEGKLYLRLIFHIFTKADINSPLTFCITFIFTNAIEPPLTLQNNALITRILLFWIIDLGQRFSCLRFNQKGDGPELYNTPIYTYFSNFDDASTG